jgi:acyl carrier protein
LRGLVSAAAPEPVRQPDESWLRRLAGMTEVARQKTLLDLVRAQTAIVLGHSAPESIKDIPAFGELGLDSFTVVELRTRLTETTGLRLPVMLLFRCPTAATLADYLGNRLLEGAPA